MATESVQEILPPSLDSTSNPPPLFDGTIRLYISYTCPYAQRVWITRNCKGLQDKIKLVPIDLQNRPTWYKEKVYPPNKVPSLEYNNEVKGESLDLIKYIDSHFEGPSLFPDDLAKREFAEELLSYTDVFKKSVMTSYKGDPGNEIGAPFDYLETALSKFDDGPFFLGQFSLVDIAYAPFMERFQPFLLEIKKYDITEGRPKLAAWIETFLIQRGSVCYLLFSSYNSSHNLHARDYPQKALHIILVQAKSDIQEMNKIEGYKSTRHDPRELL